MAKRPRPVRDRIIDAALDLAAEQPWRDIGLGQIVAASKQPLAKIHEQFASKTAIVMAVMERTSAAMMAGAASHSDDESPRDRLLDVVMLRLDELAPHKAAIRSIFRDLPADPLSVLCLAPGFMRAMAWTLESAGISASGLKGMLRTKGLAAIYVGAISVWLNDDSEDQGKTLAFLDRRLKHAERAAKFMDRTCLPRRRRTFEDTDTP